MTKFEEEVKRPVIGIGQSSIKPALGKAVEFYTDKVKEYHNAFSDMNKYIDHIEDKLDCANERIVLLEGTVDELKPQQALPVVPECVAEWYEEHKDDLDFSIFEACVTLYDDNSNDFKKWFGNSENKSIETLIRMKDGYTVEKLHLFYLKHIDMSKRDSDSDWYLIKDDEGFDHEWEFRGEMPEEERFKFTQQEIGSMNTGSYEQIEVTE